MWGMSRKSIYALLAAFVLVTLVLKLMLFTPLTKVVGEDGEEGEEGPAWPKFQSFPAFTSNEYEACISKDFTSDIGGLPTLLAQWKKYGNPCGERLTLLNQMFLVSTRSGTIKINTDEFRVKVLQWLGNSTVLYAQVMNQSIVSVFNRYTSEESIYNPLRAKRPLANTVSEQLDKIEQLYQDTKDSCDFCQYKKFTALDETGRMESKLSYTAANTFRYAVEHELIIMRKHHVLNWNREDLVDMLLLSVKWLKTKFEEKYKYPYPVISWDTLPPGGGTQFHPHVQAALTADNYPGVMESWVMAARQYHAKYQKNYFAELIRVHDSLGLTVRYKSAVALATLTPKKDNEVVIFSEDGSDDHFSLLYAVIRTYIDDKQLYSFSMSVALPKFLAPFESQVESVPAFTRIATRQRIGVPKSDVSSLELYTFFNVGSDPFALVKEIQNSVDKRLK